MEDLVDLQDDQGICKSVGCMYMSIKQEMKNRKSVNSKEFSKQTYA